MTTQSFITKNVDGTMWIGEQAYSFKTSIAWEYTIETREWGIKSIDFHVPNQTITFTIFDETLITDAEQVRIMNVGLEDVTINAPTEFGSFYPVELEIDADGACTVMF